MRIQKRRFNDALLEFVNLVLISMKILPKFHDISSKNKEIN